MRQDLPQSRPTIWEPSSSDPMRTFRRLLLRDFFVAPRGSWVPPLRPLARVAVPAIGSMPLVRMHSTPYVFLTA